MPQINEGKPNEKSVALGNTRILTLRPKTFPDTGQHQNRHIISGKRKVRAPPSTQQLLELIFDRRKKKKNCSFDGFKWLKFEKISKDVKFVMNNCMLELYVKFSMENCCFIFKNKTMYISQYWCKINIFHVGIGGRGSTFIYRHIISNRINVFGRYIHGGKCGEFN